MTSTASLRLLRAIAPAGIAALLAVSLPHPSATAQEAAARPEVGHALEAAEAAIRQKQFDTARAELAKAQAVPNHTPYETLAIEELRGGLAQASGDTDGALNAYQHLLAVQQMTPARRARMEHTIAALAFAKQDYAASADFAARAIRDGDTDPALPLMISDAAYQGGDYGRAYSLTLDQVQALRRAGKTPSKAQLQMLASAAQRAGNDAAYGTALEALATDYPDPSSTAALLARLQAKPGAASRYAADIMRLRRKLGLLTTSQDYVEAVQLALSNDYPGEAAGLIAEADSRGVFGKDPQDTRQQRLKAYASKQLADDQKGLERAKAEAGDARDGQPLVRAGYDMATQGDAAGVALIQQGIKKGGMARPEQAKLLLGEAYAGMGRKAEALAAFAAVGGTDGAADLARLWMIALKQGG